MQVHPIARKRAKLSTLWRVVSAALSDWRFSFVSCSYNSLPIGQYVNMKRNGLNIHTIADVYVECT